MSQPPPLWLWSALLAVFAFCVAGYGGFPNGDDFTYAALAEAAMDDALYPKDEQIRTFINHAWFYSLAYQLADMTFGQAIVFRVLSILLALAGFRLLMAFMTELGGEEAQERLLALLPIVAALGILVSETGFGRATYGGFISGFFHHHAIALLSGSFAILCVLRDRPLTAGIALGVAALAQPATAIHLAGAAGLAWLCLGRCGLLPLLKTAASALVVGSPMIFIATQAALSSLGENQVPEGLDLIEEVYRFRAPDHYDMTFGDLGLPLLYLICGGISLGPLFGKDPRMARKALGVLLAFVGLLAVSLVVYALGLFEWLVFFILDATRSSAFFFVFSSLLLVLGLRPLTPKDVSAGPRENILAALSLVFAVLLLLLNGGFWSYPFMAVGLAILYLPRYRAPISIAFLVLLVVPISLYGLSTWGERRPKEEQMALYSWAAEATPREALFIIPIGDYAFRYRSRRSVYIDFKSFSVSQPSQAALTLTRLQEVAGPISDLGGLKGWAALPRWQELQFAGLDCPAMAQLLKGKEADYLVAPRQFHSLPEDEDCRSSGLEIAFENSLYRVFRFPR